MALSEEHAIRRRLGVPPDAAHVLVLAESSHWDPDWLFTWDEYFARHVCRNLDAALDELVRQPRRVYSVECIFFLRMYWDASPDRRETIRALVSRGQLRLTSTGITTADTLITSTEAILRDWLVGQEWLRRNGMSVEPTVAYFPDSFGCSHSLPSLLNAAGFGQTAITRVDGMLFMGCDWPFKSRFEWVGSSAAILMRQERSLDFVWRDNSGGEVLCHWNAFTYGQGDMLAYTGLVRMYLYPLAVANRSDRNVAHRIRQYARQLLPLARTPYLFCPIGFDFVSPIPDLVALLDRYNQRHFPKTSVWAVNAGLDDYLALVACHRDQLPVLELDPNPYWTGFYSARPSLKKLTHAAVDRLLMAERMAVQPEHRDGEETVAQELGEVWSDAVVSNHHDFITGTANDRVVETEQIPWLQRTIGNVDAVIARLETNAPAHPPLSGSPELPEWRLQGGVLEVRTPHYHLELAEDPGGCIVRAQDAFTGEGLLHGPSNDLVAYEDSGGLWRMGQEFVGGTFREIDLSSRRPARLRVQPNEGSLDVSCATTVDGIEMVRKLRFQCDTPVIRCQVMGRAAERRTLTVRFETGIQPRSIAMDEPGGAASRPIQKRYVPTFWPAETFAHVCAPEGGRGMAVFLGMPGAVAVRSEGELEIVTHRNATHETAFGLVHFPGQPATGHERPFTSAEYAVLLTPSGDWLENGLPHAARSSMAVGFDGTTDRAKIDALTVSLIAVEPSSVVVSAIKPATRGPGMILRLLAPGQRGLPIAIRCLRHVTVEAWLCDARERDVRRLEIRSGWVCLSMPGSIATVRVVPGAPG